MPPATDIPKYKYRARFMGVHYWICPMCGRPNVSQLLTHTFVIKCAGDGRDYGCGRKFVNGSRLGLMTPGRVSRPDDYVLPDRLWEAMPEGDVFKWRSRYPAHMLVVEHTDDRALVEFLNEMERRIERMMGRARDRNVTVDGDEGRKQRWMAMGQVVEQMMGEWKVGVVTND